MNRDTLIVSTSDWHSGSQHALFPDRPVILKSMMPVGANEYQRRMYAHLMDCAAYVKENRKKKDLILVHNGDATEGIHHESLDHISPKWEDHKIIHIELMEDFRKAAGITRSDRTYYVSGTESHTKELEEDIAGYFDAEPAVTIGDKTLRIHHELKMKVGGLDFWYIHQGAKPGKGANEGNAVRNFLRDIYWDCKREGVKPPDFIYTSHYHKDHYDSYIDNYHTLHGHVLPSFQLKTRYAYRVAPFQRNDIGMAFCEVSAGGRIYVHRSKLMSGVNK